LPKITGASYTDGSANMVIFLYLVRFHYCVLIHPNGGLTFNPGGLEVLAQVKSRGNYGFKV
jgi:hypothetical protein